MDVNVILLNLLLECLEPDSKGEYTTSFNSEAASVMYLETVGMVEIVEGRFPETKFITFKIADDLLSGLK